MTLQHLPRDATADDALDVLEADGAVVVDTLLPTRARRALAAELTPYFDATPTGANDFAGTRTRRIGALIARCPSSRPLAVHPLVNEVAARLLAPFGHGHQLHLTQAIRIEPGEDAQWIHRDRDVWGSLLPRDIEPQLGTIWAVTRFRATNGATFVVPGSHRWPDDRQPTEDEMVPTAMNAGSVLLYTGSVLHGGGGNVSADARVGVVLQYSLDWLRQAENQYLSCPPAVARDLDPELRSLLGYRTGAGLILGTCSTPGPPGSGVDLADPGYLFGEPAVSITTGSTDRPSGATGRHAPSSRPSRSAAKLPRSSS